MFEGDYDNFQWEGIKTDQEELVLGHSDRYIFLKERDKQIWILILHKKENIWAAASLKICFTFFILKHLHSLR